MAAKRVRALRHALAEYELRSYAITPAWRSGRRSPDDLPKVPLAPAEGWVTFALVLVMCVVLALAIDDARWVLGRAEYLDMLVYTAIGGVLVGFIGPKVGWGRWLTYLIGAVFAALIVPILTGLVLHPQAPRARLVRRDGGLGGPGLVRPYDPQPRGDDAVPALHPHARPRRLGDLDVRVIRGVRAPPPAQRRDRRRRGPAREHGADRQPTAAIPHRLQHRVTLPAHPLACLR